MPDTVSVGYDGSFFMVFRMSNPTAKERQAFNSTSPCEIRFVEVQNVIFFLVHLEGMGWQDAAFTLHWYDPNPIQLMPINRQTNMGYMFTMTLFDSMTGQQISTRVVGLGQDFSDKLYEALTNNYLEPFDKQTYLQTISSIYSRYSSTALAELCPADQQYIAGTKPESRKPVENDISQGYDMPDELRRWATIPVDTLTMSIQCIPECLRAYASENEKDYIVPVPLKYVLEKGYTISESGFVYIDAKYDLFGCGLCIPEKYYETF